MLTAGQVLDHFPQLGSNDSNDRLLRMVERVDALAAAWCGFPVADHGRRTLAATTYTRFFDGPRLDQSRCLDLGIRPVVSITSAYASPDWTYASADAVASGDRVLDGQRGELWLSPSASSAWYHSPRANKVVLVAGWAELPPDLVVGLSMGVRHLMTARATQGVSAASAAGQSVTRTDADALLPEATKDALAPYRLGGALAG